MPEQIDLSHALGLEPEQALEYFRAKGYTMSWDWYDTWQEGHKKAFTVAKATQMDVLEDIRVIMEKSIKDGLSFETFQKELTPKLMRKGWWGEGVGVDLNGKLSVAQLGSPERLNTIYRTNMAVAYSAGRYRDQMENIDDRPYWQYNAIMDIATRPSHAQLNGFVFRYDDPFWNTHYPPCDWGCRCRVRALTAKQLSDKGLHVKNSAGKLQDEQVEIARGVVKTVTRFKGYGANMAPGPGWNYNPGAEDYAPTLPKYPPPVVTEYKAALKKEGLAQRIPVKNYNDITQLMQTYHDENPGIFQRGFKSVKAEKTVPGLRGNWGAATDTNGTIWIRNKSMDYGDYQSNPSITLKKALNKIEKGQDLAFEEENVIGTLWHEALHNRAKGAITTRIPEIDTTTMEALNDLVTRHTYPDFLEYLGGAEAHGENMLTARRSYYYSVRNLRSIIKLIGADEVKLMEPLKEISFNSPWLGITDDVAKVLAEAYGKPGAANSFRQILMKLEGDDAALFDKKAKEILDAIK